MFAIGNLVRVVDNTTLNLGLGQQHRVTEVHDGGATVSLEGCEGRYLAWRFEVVTPAE